MTTECPFCDMDNAYCNGVEYVCPDCDATWSCDEIPNDDDWEDNDEDDDCDYEVRIHRH